MSATGRTNQAGPQTVRNEDDNYETPSWAVRSIWPHVRPVSGLVLEPCAGRGAIVEALCSPSQGPSLWPLDDVYACELDELRALRIPLHTAHVRCCDWLDNVETLRPKLIFTNPPYKLALEFAMKAIALQQPHGGTVCLLLRLNFLGSQKRGAWLRDHIPDVYVLSRRPSFCTYVTANRQQKSASTHWWAAFHNLQVGMLPELIEFRHDGGAKIALAPSRVPAVQEWCARLPGWEGNPLIFKSGTDATEYAWFVWGPRARGRIHILEERP